VAASCCARVPQPFRAIAQPVYDAMGNPFSLPASAYFAWRYGVDIHRWDLVAGNYVQVVNFDHYRTGAYRRQRAQWNIPSPGFDRYILGGLGPAQTQERPKRGFRWTLAPRAEVLVPLHLPEAHRITLSLAPNASQGEPLPVTISWNGRTYIERALAPGFTEISFDVPAADVAVGMNVLAVRARPSPHRRALEVPPPPEPVDVGVAMGPMWIGYLPE
jgi:hypothetical protein